jgi:hypothetical protein
LWHRNSHARRDGILYFLLICCIDLQVGQRCTRV